MLLLFRILVLITVLLDLSLIFRKKFHGKEIFSWRTTTKMEFKVNTLKIGTFTTAMLLLIFMDEGINKSYRNFKIIFDVLIIALLLLLFLIPKKYIITDKGILINGLFRRWEDFISYEKKNEIIILYQKKIGLLTKIEITVENMEKVETIISQKLKAKN